MIPDENAKDLADIPGAVYYEHLGIASFGDSMLLNGMVASNSRLFVTCMTMAASSPPVRHVRTHAIAPNKK